MLNCLQGVDLGFGGYAGNQNAISGPALNRGIDVRQVPQCGGAEIRSCLELIQPVGIGINT